MLDHRRPYYCRAPQQYCGTQDEGGLKALFKDYFQKIISLDPKN